MGLLELLILNSLLCVGISMLSLQGQPLHWLEKVTPKFLEKPVYKCLMCMASVHSTYVFWNFHHSVTDIPLYIGYVLALAGLNALIERFVA